MELKALAEVYISPHPCRPPYPDSIQTDISVFRLLFCNVWVMNNSQENTQKSANRLPKIANSWVLEPEVLRVSGSKQRDHHKNDVGRRPTYVILPGRTHLKYRDIGHGPGGRLWYIGDKGRFITAISTGIEFHHDLYRWADWRWRGRIQQEIATMMPPYRLYALAPERIVVPGRIVARLRKLGAVIIFIDTAQGMRRVVRRFKSHRPIEVQQ